MQEEKFKHPFPEVRSFSRRIDLDMEAFHLQQFYLKEVKPVVEKLRLRTSSSDVKRYLAFTSMKQLYEEAVKIYGTKKMELYSDFSGTMGVDYWDMLRAEGCKAHSPQDPDFQFKPMPMGHHTPERAAKIVACIDVVEGIPTTNSQSVDRESIVVPTERERLAYEILATFADTWNSHHFKIKDVRRLFYFEKDGRICPRVMGGIILR